MSQSQLIQRQPQLPGGDSGVSEACEDALTRRKQLCPRENFWGKDEENEDERVIHVERPGTSKEEWVAKTILRRGADILCHRCLDEDDRPVVISEPHEHVPRTIVIEQADGSPLIVELAILPKRQRHCDECGTVARGGPIADRTAEAFREILDEVCASAEVADYPPSALRKARSDALAAKGRGEKHDVTILRDFVRDVLDAQCSSS